MKRTLLTILLLVGLSTSWAHAVQKVPAKDIAVTTTNFSRNLTTADSNVQHALETADQFDFLSPLTGLLLDGSNSDDTTGNMEFFKNLVIGDTADGKYMTVNRHATEGDDFIAIGVNQWRSGVISHTGGELDIRSLSDDLLLQNTAAGDVHIFRDAVIGATSNGKSTYVHKHTASTDDYIQSYVGADGIGNYRKGIITASCNSGFGIESQTGVLSLSAATGSLLLNHTAAGDVTCFSETDVGDTSNGKALNVWRKAAEGDNYVGIYIDQYKATNIYTDAASLQINSLGTINLNYSALGDVTCFDGATVADIDNGRALTVKRLAAEGNNYVKLYIDADRIANIYTDASSINVNASMNCGSNITTLGTLSYDKADWTGGNVIYCPIGGDIETYVANAAAGDTLVLASGTYTITDDIAVSKNINIVGQGVGKTTIICNTASKNIFNISGSANVRIAGMTLNYTANGGTLVRSGSSTTVVLENITGVNTDTIGTSIDGIMIGGNATLINLDITSNETGNSSRAIAIVNTGAAASHTINAYNCSGYGNGNTAEVDGWFIRNSVNYDLTINMYNCRGTAVGASGNNAGIRVYPPAGTNPSIVNIFGGVYNGRPDFVSVNNKDIRDNGGVGANTVTVYDAVLVNGTHGGSSGTVVNFGGKTMADSFYGFGATGAVLGYDKTAGTVNVAGSLKLFSAGDNAYYTTLTAGTQTANATYTMPTAAPTVDNMTLASTTIGTMSWTNEPYNQNIIYVPINGDIETYAANATAGDTLILAAGTYTLSSDCAIMKSLNIVGQGIGKTTISQSTANQSTFYIASDNVRLANMTVWSNASANAGNIYIEGYSGAVFSNIVLEDLEIISAATAVDNNYAVRFIDAGGIIRNCKISCVNSKIMGPGNAYGVLMENQSTAEAPTYLKIYNTTSTSYNTVIYGNDFCALDNSATQACFMYCYECKTTEAANGWNYIANGGDAYVNVYNSTAGAMTVGGAFGTANNGTVNVYDSLCSYAIGIATPGTGVTLQGVKMGRNGYFSNELVVDGDTTIGRGLKLNRFYSTINLDTGDAETDVGLTPGAVIFSAAIRVSTQIDGLDSADHHIQLGLTGSTSKYIDVAQGSVATSISKNKKGTYTFDTATGKESGALVLTVNGGGDNIPSAGAVEIEVVYMTTVTLPDA